MTLILVVAMDYLQSRSNQNRDKNLIVFADLFLSLHSDQLDCTLRVASPFLASHLPTLHGHHTTIFSIFLQELSPYCFRNCFNLSFAFALPVIFPRLMVTAIYCQFPNFPNILLYQPFGIFFTLSKRMSSHSLA